MPPAIISSMDRGTHCNVSFPSCAVLQNVSKASPSNGCCGACKGCILTCRSCSELINPLPCTHKANEICEHQSSAPGTEAQTTMHHFCPVRFAKSAQSRPICWVPCGLKGTHPDTQVMPRACRSIATHQQGKWNTQALIISSMNRGTNHNMSFLSCALCQVCPQPAHLLGPVEPERDTS